MKPAPFEYFVPESLQESLELLDRFGDDAKVLAGGQSLMPLMNLRLARPSVIIDINRLTALQAISTAPAGGLVVGALTRQRTIERSGVVKEQNPLLAATIPLIGHFQIRNRGTLGGSLVHADPAAELPALSVVLECELTLMSKGAARKVAAESFYQGYLTTATRPGELLTEIYLPSWQGGDLWAIEEISRRKGDFAIVGVMLKLQPDANRAIASARVVAFGIGGRPQRLQRAEAFLAGRKAEPRLADELGKIVAADLDPDSDLHASAEYRKEVGGVLARRALLSALARRKRTH